MEKIPVEYQMQVFSQYWGRGDRGRVAGVVSAAGKGGSMGGQRLGSPQEKARGWPVDTYLPKVQSLQN